MIFGPGGVGKGTIASLLVERDSQLWLSRSWTTRPRRPSEPADAYLFVDRETFLRRLAEGGFLEHNEFAGNGHFYGTPWPDPPEGRDVLLEIDVNGARQVRERVPDAVLVLILPPSPEELERRLRKRGDSDDHVASRLALAAQEERAGRAITDHVVVNDDLVGAVEQVAGIVAGHRSSTPGDA